MADRTDRSKFAQAAELPGMVDGAGVHEAPSTDETPVLNLEAEAHVDEALARFARLTEREVARRITDEAISSRLQRVRRETTTWYDEPDSDSDELAGPAFGMIQIWVRLFMAIDHRGIGLDDSDIEEIATETVAQALDGFGDGSRPEDRNERRLAFLAVCAQMLPHAYLDWWLQAGTLEVNDLQQLDELSAEANNVLNGLRRCVQDRQAAVVDTLRSWGYDDHEVDEIVASTREAVLRAYETTE